MRIFQIPNLVMEKSALLFMQPPSIVCLMSLYAAANKRSVVWNCLSSPVLIAQV